MANVKISELTAASSVEADDLLEISEDTGGGTYASKKVTASQLRTYAIAGTGTVTSVAVSGGTTGLTTSGGPITSSGTVTLGGTLAVANGGTGATDASGARTNLGLAIGSNVQAWDADLDAIAALSGTSGLLSKTGANTWVLDTASYLTGNQTVTLSGDATGSGATSITVTLANSGVSAGTYQSVTVDAKGRVTAGTNPTTLAGYGITDALSNSSTSTQSGYFGDIFLYDDATPSHYLGITNSANLTADRTLSLDVNDANRTISLSGNLTVSNTATVSGTNTGDQTITLTGDVTGSGTGSFATTLANSGVSAGTYTNATVTVDAKGRVTSASSGTGGGVSSFSAGTTGLTPSTGTTGAVTLAGTLAVANGGTGATDAGTARTNLGLGTAATMTGPTGTIVGTTDTQTLTSKTIEAGTFTNGYTEEVATANTGTAYTIDLALGSVQNLTLTGNCTFTFPTATAGRSFLLILRQDATGSRTVTWPSVTNPVRWPGGTAPTITATASRWDVYAFTADGTRWIARTIAQNYSA